MPCLVLETVTTEISPKITIIIKQKGKGKTLFFLTRRYLANRWSGPFPMTGFLNFFTYNELKFNLKTILT